MTDAVVDFFCDSFADVTRRILLDIDDTEAEALAKGRSPGDYTIRNIFQRLGQKPDPWAAMADAAVSLQAASRRLDEKA